MTSGSFGGERKLYETLRDASRYAFYSVLIGLVGALAVLVIAIVALGLASLASLPGSLSDAEFTVIGLGSAIAVLILTVAFLALELYLMLKAGRILKDHVEHGGVGARELELPAKVIYYSALGGLLGIATLIVIIGAIILALAVLGIILGTLLLGVQVRSLHEKLEKPGLLVSVGAGIQLIGLIFFGPLTLLGLAVSLIGFYMLNREATKLAVGE